jgi:hypothetical protein
VHERFAHGLGLVHQLGKDPPLQGEDLNRLRGRCLDRGPGLGPIQQAHLAKVRPRPEAGDGYLCSVRVVEQHVRLALRDNVEMVVALALAQDRLTWIETARLEALGGLEHLFVRQQGQGAGHALVDHFAVGEQHSAKGPLRQVRVVGDDEDRLALSGQVFERPENAICGA